MRWNSRNGPVVGPFIYISHECGNRDKPVRYLQGEELADPSLVMGFDPQQGYNNILKDDKIKNEYAQCKECFTNDESKEECNTQLGECLQGE